MIVSWLNRAGTVSLRGLVAFGKFWYGFVIGDDWTVAAAVAALVGGILPDRAAAQQIDESGNS